MLTDAEYSSSQNHNAIGDVQVLLKALQSTLKFESEIRAHFEPAVLELIEKSTQSVSSLEVSKTLGQTSVFTSLTGSNSSNITEESLSIGHRLLEHNPISSIFDHYLGGYVLYERNNLEVMLDKIRAEESVMNNTRHEIDAFGSSSLNAVDTTVGVYGSSMNMFEFIKSSIKRCILLNNATTFLALSHEFRTILQKYAESLRDKVPQVIGNPPLCKV